MSAAETVALSPKPLAELATPMIGRLVPRDPPRSGIAGRLLAAALDRIAAKEFRAHAR